MKKKPFENLSIRIRFIFMIMLELICVSLISWIVMDVLHISDVPYIVWIILASVIAGGVLNNFLSIRYFGPVLKLEKAMQCFPLTPNGKVCMDIGASTGGFTDCMLQNGATKVYSVDVGQGQLAWKLRNDERVVCMEQTNFRYVTPEDIPDALDFASVDVSFISLTKILIPARNLLKTGGQMVCLIKPQFEAGRGKVGKNGVVREPQIHEEVIRKIIDYADSIGFEVLHLEYSPIKGPEGNIEYLLHIRKPEEISEEKLALTEHEAESALQTIIEEKTGLSYTPEWDAVIKGIVDNSHTL